MLNNYVIITRKDEALFYDAADVKEAICEYASYISFRIESSILKKIVPSLSVEELIRLFNQECWDWGDEIKQIITGYTTLYEEKKKEDE